MAIVLATGVVTLSGCDTTTDPVQVIEQIKIASVPATVSGIVRDTNGNGIEGASVAIVGNEAVLTDTTGAYIIEEVRVTGFNLDQDDAVSADGLTVTVNVEGYMAAMLTVEINSANVAFNNTTIDGLENGNADAVATAVQEGVAVAVHAAILPKLGSGIIGVLRNDETGEPIANAKIALDYLAYTDYEYSLHEGTVLGAQSLVTMTDATGAFVFENLPVDSSFRMDIEGWENSQRTVSTTSEDIVLNLGDWNVEKITSSDDTKPLVKSVNRVYSDASTGLLDDDAYGDAATNGITIHFTEALATIQDLETLVDENSVTVILNSEGGVVLPSIADIQNVALAADGKSLYFETVLPIPENTVFDILLLRPDFEDMAGNTLNYDSDEKPSYDSIQTTNAASYVKLRLKTYKEPVKTGDDVIDFAQVAETATTELHNVNFTFASVIQDENSQLNSEEATARLASLGNEITQASTYVNTSTAQTTFTIPAAVASASGYQIEVYRDGEVESSVAVIVKDNVVTGLVKEYDADEVVTATFSDAEHNDVVRVTAYNDFDMLLSSIEVILKDQVAPTTVLQTSYLNTTANLGDGVTAINYGNGGELTQSADGINPVIPVLAITPRLLTPQTGNVLYSDSQSPWIDLSAIINPEGADDTVNLSDGNDKKSYDKAGYKAWEIGSRRIGVAFSENIVAVTDATPTTTAVTSALSGWTVQNDVTVNDAGIGIDSVDLYTFTVDNVLTLANTDHAREIDFTGVIADEVNGNVSAAINNAKVVLNDRTPALITEADYNGEAFVITFNEAVLLQVNDVFDIDGFYGPSATVTIAQLDNVTNVGNVYTIPMTDVTLNTSKATLYAAFNRAIATTAAPTPTKLTLLSSQTVEDVQGNKWSDWTDLSEVTNNGVATPLFIAETSIPPFGNAVTSTTFTATSTAYTLTVVYAHPIVEDDADDILADLDGTAASLADLEDGDLILSADKTIVTITAEVVTALTAGETIILPAQVSDYTDAYIAAVTFTVPTPAPAP